ncbi:MAG: 4-alpha-glucanotransferase [Chloroflexi bacterium]|nr:4-alpha-glucanotransferase [Chloroflexota bacterium]
MKLPRSSGILLHPTSLPGSYGIGDLGPEAYRWVDFLAEGGFTWWQLLPLGPTGFADSPYQSFSAFAGNPMLISPELLQRDGLLENGDLDSHPDFPDSKVDFAAVNEWKKALLAIAHRRVIRLPALQLEFETFKREQADWLEDYALFRAIKTEQGEGPWSNWPQGLRDRETLELEEARSRLAESIENYAFHQFLFFRQWEALRSHMQARNVQVIGDIPIYVAMDSAEVWANRNWFYLDSEGQPISVAGVPPDYFSKTGQLWGNPLYRWDKHAEQGYKWWLKRLMSTLLMVDIVRLDHFRGFAGYWAVPAGQKTAETGQWEAGPGEVFFETMREKLGELPLIAEDLGEITQAVIELRDEFDLPGMKILQFAFDDGLEHKFLPHNYAENFVAYTGTHDNDTVRGWYMSAPEAEKVFCRDYLGVDGSDIAWDMIRAVWASRANVAIAPIQDVLDLGTEARMNFPGTIGGNWDWRMPADALRPELSRRLADLNQKHDRNINK